MSIIAIILINIALAGTLLAILAALMLAPTRLRRHFAEGFTHRQKAALHAQHQVEASQQRRHRATGREPAWRPIQDV